MKKHPGDAILSIIDDLEPLLEELYTDLDWLVGFTGGVYIAKATGEIDHPAAAAKHKTRRCKDNLYRTSQKIGTIKLIRENDVRAVKTKKGKSDAKQVAKT